MSNIKLIVNIESTPAIEEKKAVFQLVIKNKDNVEFLQHLYGQYNFFIEYYRDTEEYIFLPRMERIGNSNNPLINIKILDTKPNEVKLNKVSETVVDYSKIGPKPETFPLFKEVANIPRLRNATKKEENLPIVNHVDKIKHFKIVDNINSADYGLEIEGSKRVWFQANSSDVHNLVKETGITICEVLSKNTRFFVDLDDKYNRCHNFKDVFVTIINEFGRFFNLFYNHMENIDKENQDEVLSLGKWFNFYITTNTTEKYNSAHLYVTIYDISGNEIISRFPNEQHVFWMKFSEYLDNKFETDTFQYVIDMSLYKKNSQLRVPFAKKNETYHNPFENCYYRIFNNKTTSYKSRNFVLCYHKSKCDCHEEEHSYEEQKDGSFLLTYYDVCPIVNASPILKTIKSYKKTLFGKFQDDYMTEQVIEESKPNYHDFYVNRGIAGGKFLYVPNITSDSTIVIPTHNTKFEKILMKRYLEESTLDISKRQVWQKTAYIIYCFYWFLSLPQRINIVISFFSKRGWSDQKSKKENIDFCLALNQNKRHHNYSLLIIQEHFQIVNNNIKAEMPIINYGELENLTNNYNKNEFERVTKINKNNIIFNKKPVNGNFMNNRIIALKSGCSTHKTASIFKEYGHKIILFISSRRSLATEMVEKYGLQHYKDGLSGNVSAVCQLESLHLYGDIIHKFDFIILDECELICAELKFAHYTNPKKFPVLDAILQYIFNEKRVILLSANLGELSRYLLKCFNVDDAAYFENTFAKQKGLKYEILDNKNAHMSKVIELLKAGKKVIVPINSVRYSTAAKKIVCKKLVGHIEQIGKKVLVINSYTDPVSVDKWREYDVVIYTNSITAGNSIDYEHFDTVCAYFHTNAGTHDACFQMLFRLRNILDKKIYICIKDTVKSDSDDKQIKIKLRERDIGNKEYAQSIHNEKIYHDDVYKAIDTVDNKFSLDDYTNMPLYKMLLFYGHYERYSRYNFRKLLIKELQDIGMEEYTDSEIKVIEKFEFNKGVNKILGNLIEDSLVRLKQIESLNDRNEKIEEELLSGIKENLVKEYEENKISILKLINETNNSSSKDLAFKINRVGHPNKYGQLFSYINKTDSDEKLPKKNENLDCGDKKEETKYKPAYIDEVLDRNYNFCNFIKGNLFSVKKDYIPIAELLIHIGNENEKSHVMYDNIIEFIKIKGNKLFATVGNNTRNNVKQIISRKGKNMYNMTLTMNKYLRKLNYKLVLNGSSNEFCQLEIIDKTFITYCKQEYVDCLDKSFKEIFGDNSQDVN